MKGTSTFFLAGAALCAISGTLLHFAYEASGDHALVGLIAPVNESVWEHLKLLFWPVVLYTLLLWPFVRRQIPAWWAVMTIGLCVGLILIPVLFYTYSGILGTNVTWVDIALFFVGVAAVFLTAARLTRSRFLSEHARTANTAALIVLALWAVAFAVFTESPPPIGIFSDPLAQTQ